MTARICLTCFVMNLALAVLIDAFLKETCLDIYSRCVNAQAPLMDILDTHFPYCSEWEEELNTLFAHYAKTKIEQVSLDYDDLLLYCFHMAQVDAIAQKVESNSTMCW